MNPAGADPRIPALAARWLTGTPPELGPGPRGGVESVAQIDARLADATAVRSSSRTALRGLVLLWHDHWELAHVVAQDLSDATGSYLHGMAHRREPDYWNAKYWFRRVSAHPAWPAIAHEVAVLRESVTEFRAFDFGGSPIAWDPLAFVDFVAGAAELPADHPRHQFAREAQAQEFHCLLRHLVGG